MAAIDLYSGIGGWSLGFKLAGVPIIASYEWWKEANKTHNFNFGTNNAEVDIRALKLEDLPSKRKVKYVVGSPPCTQFSFSNRGGQGDIKDGLKDIKKFLEIVEYLEPTFWAMENVPRVANILDKELSKGSLRRFKYLFDNINVYNSSDFGVPQDRKRMIAGRLPFDLLESYRNGILKVNLGDVVTSLEKELIIDPLYNIEIKKNKLTDHVYETNLTEEEEWINSQSKTHHPVYNKMSFPDRQDRPARTVTAVCTRVSRESIVIRDSKNNLRRLTVRERAALQSFPFNYQFAGNSYNSKIKMIGNAIPPLMTFYIAQAMKRTKTINIIRPHNAFGLRDFGNNLSISSIPDNEGSNFSAKRSFWYAIKGLRFGSGVRFELKNSFDKESDEAKWRINFFYGQSKNIKEKKLDFNLFNEIQKCYFDKNLHSIAGEINAFAKKIDEINLQQNWIKVNCNDQGPIKLINELSKYAYRINQIFSEAIREFNVDFKNFISDQLKNGDSEIQNKKILEEQSAVLAGLLLGSIFNSTLEGKFFLKKDKKLELV